MQGIIQQSPDWLKAIDTTNKPDVGYYQRELIGLPRIDLSEIVADPTKLHFLATRPEGLLFSASDTQNSDLPYSTIKLIYGINLQNRDDTSSQVYESLAHFKANSGDQMRTSIGIIMNGFESDNPASIRGGAEELACRFKAAQMNWESTKLSHILTTPEVIIYNKRLAGIKINHATKPKLITDSKSLLQNPEFASDINETTYYKLLAFFQMAGIKVPEPFFKVKHEGTPLDLAKSLFNLLQQRWMAPYTPQYILDEDKTLIGVAHTQFVT